MHVLLLVVLDLTSALTLSGVAVRDGGAGQPQELYEAFIGAFQANANLWNTEGEENEREQRREDGRSEGHERTTNRHSMA